MMMGEGEREEREHVGGLDRCQGLSLVPASVPSLLCCTATLTLRSLPILGSPCMPLITITYCNRFGSLQRPGPGQCLPHPSKIMQFTLSLDDDVSGDPPTARLLPMPPSPSRALVLIIHQSHIYSINMPASAGLCLEHIPSYPLGNRHFLMERTQHQHVCPCRC